MTKTQFRHDLRRGLGSCPLELVDPCGLLTPELIEECRRDCYQEIRDYVKLL